MALQSSGNSISFSNIEAEFGNTGPSRNIGKYRVKETVGGMSNLPLDEGIPQSGTIRFSDFYGKQLNIIVSYTSNEILYRPSTGKYKYNNNRGVTVIGGFRSKPSSSSGSRITLHVHPNTIIGSSNNSQKHCALRTGSGWPQSTELEINIGKNAVISGAGGYGGKGGKPDGKIDNHDEAGGFDGGKGSSAIGIQYEVDKIVIQDGAVVRAGCGGGGGGGGAAGELENSDERVGGGGGGGGQGIPAGVFGEAGSDLNTGGEGSTAYGNVEEQPQDGQYGSSDSGGNGGNGGRNNEGNSEDSAQSGGGGGGGGFGNDEVGEGGSGLNGSDGGQDGSRSTNGDGSITIGDGGNGGKGEAEGTGQQRGPGGSGGEVGYAIVREQSGYISSSEITGNGNYQGSISTGEVN